MSPRGWKGCVRSVGLLRGRVTGGVFRIPGNDDHALGLRLELVLVMGHEVVEVWFKLSGGTSFNK